MEKIFEKKNLGIPTALLTAFAYLIGYYLSNDYSGFLVALIFAVIVFSLNFDEKVKNAVKQSYIIGVFFCLIYFGLSIVYQFSNLVTSINFLSNLITKFYNSIHNLFSIFVIVVYALLVITALFNKDIKLGFLMNMIGEGTPKAQPMQQGYQQPIPSMYQQPVPPMPQQGASNQAQQAKTACPKCGAINPAGAVFCASCGNKMQ